MKRSYARSAVVFWAELLVAVACQHRWANAAVIYTDNPDLTISGPSDRIQFEPFSQQAVGYNALLVSSPNLRGALLYDNGYHNGAGWNYFFGQAVSQANDNTVSKLPLGTVIDASLNYTSVNSLSDLLSNWIGGGQGLLGFKTNAGNYGWARLDVVPVTPTGYTLTLLDFAVESVPGVAIAGPVPEPSAFVLAGLGILGLFFAARRKRRA